MVLHNDKWKYKAKKAVERKNAQKAKRNGIDDTKVNHENSSSGNEHSSDDSEEGDDVEEIVDEDGNVIVKPTKKEKLNNQSNSWRFEDPVIDESILKDPEYIAQLEAKRKEEEDRINHMRDIVSNKLKTGDIIDENSDEYLLMGKKEPVSFKNMKFEDLENVFNADDKDNNKPEFREFTDEEKERFLCNQAIMKHQKEVQKLKTQVNSLNSKLTRGKVLELNSNRGKDNYRDLVDKKLGGIHKKVDEEADLDELVHEMIGIDLKKVGDTTAGENEFKSSAGFNLENLMDTKAGLKNQSIRQQTQKEKKSFVETSNEDDDFLDSLL